MSLVRFDIVPEAFSVFSLEGKNVVLEPHQLVWLENASAHLWALNALHDQIDWCSPYVPCTSLCFCSKHVSFSFHLIRQKLTEVEHVILCDVGVPIVKMNPQLFQSMQYKLDRIEHAEHSMYVHLNQDTLSEILLSIGKLPSCIVHLIVLFLRDWNVP